MKCNSPVITGIGVVAATGIGTASFWGHLAEGRSAIGPMRRLAVQRPFPQIAGEFADIPTTTHGHDRFCQLAQIAAEEALTTAGPSPEAARCAVIVGSGGGGAESIEQGYQRVYRDGLSGVSPLTIPKMMCSAASSAIAQKYQFMGPGFAISSACASGAHAVAMAAILIRAGLADRVVCGGAEAPLTEGSIRAWHALRVLAHDTCRPFSLHRQGLVLAEGAGILVVDREDQVPANKVLARLVGIGMSNDAHDLLKPITRGPVLAMQTALKDAGLVANEIGHINAHGSGTLANDRMEAEAITEVFGPAPIQPPITATKSITGHAMGASSALELVASVLAIHHDLIPPTANYLAEDPNCAVDLVRGAVRPGNGKPVLSNAFAFGGLNVSIILAAP